MFLEGSECMKRIFALLMVAVLLLGLLPVSAAGDAMDTEKVKTLLNSVELQPQRTGYPQVDAILEEILAPYAEADNYTKVKAAYDWTVREVNYSWGPYSQDWAPAYDCFVPVYELEYEEGLEEAIPFEVVNRSYHALVEREGICYDYGALFALMARYIGFESFVHTGYFVFEAGFGTGSGHHGWAEIKIGEEYYIFDPQREYRMCGNGVGEIEYLYFGIDEDHAWRFDHETAVNAARDAGFLSVSAPRHCAVEVVATAGGTASVMGDCVLGQPVTIKAEAGERAFDGWYTEEGELLSREAEYSFLVTEPVTVYAVFQGEYFRDIAGQWYEADAVKAYEMELINGMGAFTFDGEGTMTRAMALTVLYRMVKPEGEFATASYVDVIEGSWYEAAVNWGTREGIVNGVGKNRFAPDSTVTREQFITMIMRLCRSKEEAELTYTDKELISPYALTAMKQAQAAGLIKGYNDNTLRPQEGLRRCEAVALAVRLMDWMET